MSSAKMPKSDGPKPAEAEPPRNIYQRLLAVMACLEAPAKGHGSDVKYAFHRIDDVAGALRPSLVSCGVWMKISPVSMEREEKTQSTQYGEKPVHVSSIVLDVTFINVDDPEDVDGPHRIEGQGWDYSDKSDGKAWSYALKPFLLATFNMRGAPDNEDDNIEGARSRSRSRSSGQGGGGEREYPSAKAARQVRELAEKGDAADAWKAVAAAIKSLDDGKGGMLRPDKITALFAAAQKNGWSKDDVLAKLKDVAGVSTAQIPWKAGEAVLAAFESLPRPVHVTTATAAKRPPVWEDWEIIKEKIGEVDSDAPNCERQELLDQVAQASGWPSSATTRVLREELALEPEEIPRGLPVDLIGRLLKAFNPQDILPRYEAKENPPDDDAPEEPGEEGPEVDPTLISRALAPLKTKAFPGSDEANAWELFLRAVGKLADLPRITDLSAFDDPERTGGRDRAGVVDALADIGLEPADCPLVLQGSLLTILAAFPIPEESEDA